MTFWDHYTSDVARIVTATQGEARRLNHNYIGTEHMMLAVVADPVGARALDRLGIDPDALRDTIEREVGPGRVSPDGVIPMSGRAKRILSDFAPREAANADADPIDVSHFVLGLLREGAGIAAQALTAHGVDLKAARAALTTRGRR